MNVRTRTPAPVPLDLIEAIKRAGQLRHQGMQWPAIALVMREYHGWGYDESWWRRRTKLLGLHTPNPNKRHGATA